MWEIDSKMSQIAFALGVLGWQAVETASAAAATSEGHPSAAAALGTPPAEEPQGAGVGPRER